MNKKLFYSLVALITIIVIIFSVDLVFYIRLHRKKVKKNIHTEEIKTEEKVLKRDSFRYKSSYKNPFLSFSLEGDTFGIDSTKKEEILTLKGIVLGPGKPVVVLEDKDGNTVVLKKGETLNDLTLVSVKKNSVKVKYKKKDYTLKIWEE